MKTLLTLLAAAALAGCASFSPDGGFGAVEQAARDRLGPQLQLARGDGGRARVAELLREPLSADAAVQVALLANRGLQAAYAELGIAEADLVQAGRLSNPRFSFGRMTREGEVEYERGLHFGLAALLAMPLAQEAGRQRFAQAQGAAALAVLQLAADTRRAWVQAVAAQENLRYAGQVMEAAEAGAELARRMAQVGNFSRLQRSREQAFEADAATALARAKAHAQATRERLTRLLGLWGEDAAAYRLPERLPDLPPGPAERPDIEREALALRLDVRAAQQQLAQARAGLGLARAAPFTEGVEVGVMRNGSNEEAPQRGWELGFEIPLFDWGGPRRTRAEAVQAQAAHRAAQVAVDARSEVREAYAAYRHAWDIARHQRDVVVPLAKTVSEENLLRYNGMFIGVFELLADARAQITAVQGAIDAQRDFWLAEADLQMALVGRPPSGSLAGLAAPTKAAPAAADPH